MNSCGSSDIRLAHRRDDNRASERSRWSRRHGPGHCLRLPPVGVAAKIGEDMFGRAGRWFGIDHPVLATKPPDHGKALLAGGLCREKPFEEEPPEQAGENMDGQKEA